MGFLDKFLKGLGFEDEEPKTNQVKKKKKVRKEKIKTNNSGYASFDLNEEEQTKEEIKEEKITENKEQQQTSGSFSIIKVTTQVEVQAVVDKIKLGENVLINLTGMSGVDITRSLDFLTGVVYALDKTMQKVDGNVYLIQ